MKSRGANLFRITAGFAAGSAVGWMARDRQTYSLKALFGRNEESYVKDYGVGQVWSLSEATNFKPPVPWDKNWDRWVGLTRVCSRVWVNSGLSKNRRDDDGTGRSILPTAGGHIVALLTRRADNGSTGRQ